MSSFSNHFSNCLKFERLLPSTSLDLHKALENVERSLEVKPHRTKDDIEVTKWPTGKCGVQVILEGRMKHVKCDENF